MMSARDYMAALDAYLDARDARKTAEDAHEEAMARGAYGPHRIHALNDADRELSTARCALEREVEPLIRAAEYVRYEDELVADD